MCMYIHIAVVHLQCFGEKKCNAKMSIIYTNEWYINKQTKDPSPPKKKRKKEKDLDRAWSGRPRRVSSDDRTYRPVVQSR